MSLGQYARLGLLILGISVALVLAIAFGAPSLRPVQDHGVRLTSHANQALENYIYQGRFQR